MHYTENPGSVRVDFFRPSGKWYMTEAWNMSAFFNHDITPIDAVIAMLSASERGIRLMKQFTVVVLDPYHKHAYPVMLVAKDAE